jgi:MFS transporter, DHA3 family, macrolide efflux protein
MVRFPRSFVLLWQGQLVSQLGNQAFLIATAYYLVEETGSSRLVAAVMMAATVPLAVVAPIAGAVADRYSRRRLMLVTDLVRSVVVGALGVFILLAPEASPRHVALVVGAAGISGIMAAFFTPAAQALIPELVPADRLAIANQVNQVSTQTSMLLGQAMGGVLYAATGAAGLLLFDAASFAYGALATWLIPAEPLASPADMRRRLGIRHHARATLEGFAYVRRRAGMTAVLAIFAAVNFLFMPVFVLLPFYTQQVLSAGAEWYGFLLAGFGVGALAGSTAAGVVLARARSRSVSISVCLGGVACCVLVLSLARTPALALAAFAGVGAASSIINVTVITALQSAVPNELRGRVMALVVAISTAAAPLGMAVGGLLGDAMRGALPVVFGSCGLALGALAVLTWRLRGVERVLDSPGADRGDPPAP